MLFGLCTLANPGGLSPADLGREAEARNLESAWFADHSHIPVKRESPWPGGPELPQSYYDILEPLACMAAGAAVTTRLRLGSGVLLVVERDPIHTAKALATLDFISGGRIEVGVGAGWNLEELRNHGTDPTTRWQLLRERVEAMEAIWTNDPAEYHGRFVGFDPIICRPLPVQQPHPPVHIGGAAPHGYRRALRYGNGWIPMLGRGDDDFAKHVRELKREADGMGRSLDDFQVTVFSAAHDLALLESYQQAGITRVLFSVPGNDRDLALRALDDAARTRDRLS